MQDKPLAYQQVTSDLNLERLYRKFNDSLPELKSQHTPKNSDPFICPIIFTPQSKFIIAWQILNIILIYIYFMQIPIILAFGKSSPIQKTTDPFKTTNVSFSFSTFLPFSCSFVALW